MRATSTQVVAKKTGSLARKEMPEINISNLLNDEIKSLPARGLAVVAVRAAKRVQPILASWLDSQYEIKSIEQSIEIALSVLQNRAQPDDALAAAEIAHRLAALAAVDFRVSKSDTARSASCAGVVIHSAIDAVADLETDTQAVICNVMQSAQSTHRLNEPRLIRAMCQDFDSFRPV